MFHHRRRAGYMTGVPAALVLTLAFTAGCGPAGDSGDASGKAAKKSVTPSPTATSNGLENLRPAEILSRARKATAAARFVRLRGQVEDGGEKYEIDLRFAGRTMATGWVQQRNERAQLTRIGKTVYLAGNDAFWKAIGGKGAVQVFSGKHIKAKLTNPDFKEMAVFANRTELLTEALKGASGWRKEKPGRIGSVPTVVLSNSAGDKLQVAAQGQPYLLLLEGGREDRIEYLDYGQPVTVKAPPANSVIDPALMD